MFGCYSENLAIDVKEQFYERYGKEVAVESHKIDKMKSTLAMEVVSAERNAELLETGPHKDIEDMAVVYRFVICETSTLRSLI